ncbi:hypothetical protein EOA30_06375 [Mesorhizobium sp. M8A.F.Ca.ET.059.01.1.1]|nr:hypothetical protein EOA30_06375 [Mesorhizobium sp. M8A.F.Ca.ET.059.01.1.1]
MLDLLQRHPDLVGCYIAGGGMEDAVMAVRMAMPVKPLVLICNEITSESRAALANIITMGSQRCLRR